jgi:hypothetical protein
MKPPEILFMVILGQLGLLADPVSDLLPPQKRAETLALARTLLTIKPIDSTEEELAAMNPFNPIPPVVPGGAGETSVPQMAVTVVLSDRDLLKKMADSITPSGMMQLGDRAILLVGKKKLKVGDRLSVNTDGTAYELEVSAIDRTSFTLRLKNEEITRPIKAPAKKP